MSKLSKLSSSKRFTKSDGSSLKFYKTPKDLDGMVAWIRQMAEEFPGQKFMLNDDALSIEERKKDPEKWAMLEQAIAIVTTERLLAPLL